MTKEKIFEKALKEGEIREDWRKCCDTPDCDGPHDKTYGFFLGEGKGYSEDSYCKDCVTVLLCGSHPEMKKPRSNIDDRWTVIGKLVEKHGSQEEKVAWALCRGDAAQWKIASEGGFEGVKEKLRKEMKERGEEKIDEI